MLTRSVWVCDKQDKDRYTSNVNSVYGVNNVQNFHFKAIEKTCVLWKALANVHNYVPVGIAFYSFPEESVFFNDIFYK